MDKFNKDELLSLKWILLSHTIVFREKITNHNKDILELEMELSESTSPSEYDLILLKKSKEILESWLVDLEEKEKLNEKIYSMVYGGGE